jgi:glycosyltransferase involved in cell wall biosynthesis
MDKVSIIVAIYNSEKFLRKNIESIINQTYKNLEIILVDDGSPDGCPAICDEYAAKDDRIVVIHKKNGGTCEARNYGLARMTGDYVSIIDGDDWLEFDYVEYLMNLIKKTNSDMSITDHIFTTRDREQVRNDKIETWTNEDTATAIIYPRFAIGPWNKMYKVSMLREHNLTFSVPWSGEGLYFSCMAAQYSNHVGVGHKKIYNYRLNNAGSGLTHYRVVMGTNALANIKNIGKVSVIQTPKFMHAVQWHIWKNYNYVLFLIIATNSQQENKKLYDDCLKNIRIRLPRVLIDSSYFSFKGKIRMLIQGLMPVIYAKRDLQKQREALANDTME